MNNLNPSEHGRILSETIALVEDGKLTPHVSNTFSLEEIPAAHAQQESQRTRGKLAVTMT